MRTKLEDFYDRKLYELLQDAIKERDGWAQDRTYQLICAAAQLSTPHEQIPETGADIMKLREAAAARFPSFPSVIPPASLAQYYRDTVAFPGTPDYQIEKELNELKAFFRPSEEKK